MRKYFYTTKIVLIGVCIYVMLILFRPGVALAGEPITGTLNGTIGSDVLTATLVISGNHHAEIYQLESGKNLRVEWTVTFGEIFSGGTTLILFFLILYIYIRGRATGDF